MRLVSATSSAPVLSIILLAAGISSLPMSSSIAWSVLQSASSVLAGGLALSMNPAHRKCEGSCGSRHFLKHIFAAGQGLRPSLSICIYLYIEHFRETRKIYPTFARVIRCG
jgi:hypothetical protein